MIAPDCMTADSYATAFMVMGKDRAMEIVEADPDLEGYFICDAGEGFHKTYASSGLAGKVKDY